MVKNITHKSCAICKEAKPISSFSRKGRKTHSKIRFLPDCRDCRSETEKQRKRDKKIQYVNYLGGECIRCGYNLPEGIDFHHIDPSIKSFGIAESSLKFDDFLKAELRKCAPLCRNCHSEFHAGRFDLGPLLHKLPKFNENTEKQDSIRDDSLLGLQISFVD